MYYLAKFCRICIQSHVTLIDIDTVDFDEVKLSEKLEVCAKMVVGRESLSTEICVQCVIKLRISYQFYTMCKKSSKMLQGYLEELIGPGKVDPDNFVNNDLSVCITPVPHTETDSPCKRKRISKGQRCSLLKKLLTQNPNHEPCDEGGGLRNIINFTRNYEFNYSDKSKENPLDKLTEFSKDFFRNDFSQFRDTILYIIENKDNTDSEEDLFDFSEEDEDENDNKIVKFEEMIIEPDIQIKNECLYEEEDCTIEIKEEEEEEEEDISQNAMQLLDRLVENYPHGHRKTFSSSSVRCRTRNNPYISPMLKQQFLFRNFKCNRCDRYFKSPGYLKAHKTKVHLHDLHD
ncbi:unnamed protein product [Brassicogethes aeneus]|uniref:ZAD domain-containing protein n=1 Tax=Brassicogethes aeneus TaxID=1431903 RepID=A0A9P0FI98_BRAAE|nr:unnamed protein product [Brassicogethes aeneus]